MANDNELFVCLCVYLFVCLLMVCLLAFCRWGKPSIGDYSTGSDR